MNFILNIIWQHVSTAVFKNWGFTVAGLIFGILDAGHTLAPYFQGTDIQHVKWGALWHALVPIVMGALGKSGINFWSLATSVFDSVPRAELVKKGDDDGKQ